MKKSTVGLCVSILMILLWTGCRPVSPLGSRLFVENAGIDQSGAGLTLSMNTYLADLQESADAGRFLMAEGFSITAAMEAVTRSTGREPYFPHNSALIIGRSAAEKGIAGILQFFTGYNGCRTGVPLFIAEETAEKVIEAVQNEKNLDPRALGELADADRNAGRSLYAPLYKAVYAGKNGTADLCVPILSVQEGTVIVSGSAVFRESRMVTTLSGNQTAGVLLTAGMLRNTVIHGEIAGYGRMSLAVTVKDARLSCDGDAESGWSFTLHAVCEAMPFEWNFASELPEEESFYQTVTAYCSEQLTAWAESAVQRARTAGADPCGLGDFLRQTQPRQWSEMENGWRTQLRRLRFSAEVEVQYCTPK